MLTDYLLCQVLFLRAGQQNVTIMILEKVRPIDIKASFPSPELHFFEDKSNCKCSGSFFGAVATFTVFSSAGCFFFFRYFQQKVAPPWSDIVASIQDFSAETSETCGSCEKEQQEYVYEIQIMFMNVNTKRGLK